MSQLLFPKWFIGFFSQLARYSADIVFKSLDVIRVAAELFSKYPSASIVFKPPSDVQ